MKGFIQNLIFTFNLIMIETKKYSIFFHLLLFLSMFLFPLYFPFFCLSLIRISWVNIVGIVEARSLKIYVPGCFLLLPGLDFRYNYDFYQLRRFYFGIMNLRGNCRLVSWTQIRPYSPLEQSYFMNIFGYLSSGFMEFWKWPFVAFERDETTSYDFKNLFIHSIIYWCAE